MVYLVNGGCDESTSASHVPNTVYCCSHCTPEMIMALHDTESCCSSQIILFNLILPSTFNILKLFDKGAKCPSKIYMDRQLPAEVLRTIFTFLSPRELLFIEETCRTFQKLLFDDLVWHTIYMQSYPSSKFGLDHCSTWKEVYLMKNRKQYAWNRGNRYCLVSQIAHSDGINSIAAQKVNGPIQNLFATCSFDRSVKIWRKPAQREIFCQPVCTMVGHQNAVWSLAWGHQSNELFSASFDGTIRRWDVETSINTRVLWANADRLLCMVVEEYNIWTGSLTGHMIQWNHSSPNPMTGRIQCITPCISSLKKVDHLLYVGGVKHLEIWDDRYLQAPLTLLKGHEQAIMSIAHFSETILLTVSKDGTLKAWNAQGVDSSPLIDIRIHKAAVRSLVTCDNIIATSSNDSTVYLWQAKHSMKTPVENITLSKLDEIRVHTKQVPCVDMDECHLYTASCDTTMTIHEYTLP